MVSTSAQLLKAYGHLPGVGLSKLADAHTAEVAGRIDSDVLATRCCGHPDLPDEEIAYANPEDLQKHLGFDLQSAVTLKYAHAHWLEATGRGSWPAGCHQDLYPHPDRHCVTYFVRRGTFNKNYTRPAQEDEIRHLVQAGVWKWPVEDVLDRWLDRPILDCALEFTREAWRRAGVHFIPVEDEPKADIILLSRPIPGSTIGIGWFNNGKCRPNVVESHYDSSWQPSLYRLALLLLHETGHNMNLQHTFSGQNRHRGIMSYNWPNNFYGFLEGDEGILPRDPSWDALIKFFGGEPIPLTDGPTLPPVTRTPLPPHSLFAEQTVSGAIAIRGGLRMPAGFRIERDTTYIALPKPGRPGEYELQEVPLV